MGTTTARRPCPLTHVTAHPSQCQFTSPTIDISTPTVHTTTVVITSVCVKPRVLHQDTALTVLTDPGTSLLLWLHELTEPVSYVCDHVLGHLNIHLWVVHWNTQPQVTRVIHSHTRIKVLQPFLSYSSLEGSGSRTFSMFDQTPLFYNNSCHTAL